MILLHFVELFGKVLKVNFAQPSKIKGGDLGWASQPVWADTDDWYEKRVAEEQILSLEEEQKKKTEKEALQSQIPEEMRSNN